MKSNSSKFEFQFSRQIVGASYYVNTKNLHKIQREIRMASNQTNQIQNLKQIVTNLLTEMLRVLENAENITNTNEFIDSMSEVREAQRALAGQAIQILEENGIETEALVNTFATARNQSSSDAEVTEAQESCVNLVRQVLRELLSNPRMIELNEELNTYYGRILNHESMRELHEDAHEHLLLVENWPSRQVDLRFMAEVGERLKAMLRKFLEVETLLNDQQNWCWEILATEIWYPINCFPEINTIELTK